MSRDADFREIDRRRIHSDLVLERPPRTWLTPQSSTRKQGRWSLAAARFIVGLAALVFVGCGEAEEKRQYTAKAASVAEPAPSGPASPPETAEAESRSDL